MIAVSLPSTVPAAGSEAGSLTSAAAAPHQATPSPAPGLADLSVAFHYDHWWDYGCLHGSQPWVTTLTVTNSGDVAATAFVVQDRRARWRLPGLAAGETAWVREWGRYPEFPLVVDAYGQVPESNEANNVVEPPEGDWTPTPSAARARPRPGLRPASPGRDQPRPLRTLPAICGTRTPVPTPTPAGPARRPDLVVASAVWDRLTVQLPGAAAPCRPLDDPWHLVVTIENRGQADAGWFPVVGGEAVWRVHGLAAGQSLALRSEPRFLPDRIVVDDGDWVEEGQEDNNTWTAPPGATPTPPGPAAPYCAITATPTGGPTGTDTPPLPTATRTASPTLTPSASATPTPVPVLLPLLARDR
jgi:hypothetical protein